jgi:hypothetical protein
MCFNLEKVKEELDSAFRNNSEQKLLDVLKQNSFLFYPLYSRHGGIQPNFAEVSFGGKLRCDFCWLNDNSDGPEWVLVEIEEPKLRLFTANVEPTFRLNHAIEQVQSWRRYFDQYPAEKRRIFGAVAKLRYILVAGAREEWERRHAAIWRADFNRTDCIEIRSVQIFYDALDSYIQREDDFWSFKEHPVSLKCNELEAYWSNYDYIQQWRTILG